MTDAVNQTAKMTETMICKFWQVAADGKSMYAGYQIAKENCQTWRIRLAKRTTTKRTVENEVACVTKR